MVCRPIYYAYKTGECASIYKSHTSLSPIFTSNYFYPLATTMPPLPQQLELVAAEVICILKRIKRIGRSKLAVIGGLAAWKHDPFNRRETRVDWLSL